MPLAHLLDRARIQIDFATTAPIEVRPAFVTRARALLEHARMELERETGVRVSIPMEIMTARRTYHQLAADLASLDRTTTLREGARSAHRSSTA